MPSHRVHASHRFAAFGALIVLATLSLVVGTRLHWNYGDVAISLTIAAIKTYLVVWFFMDMAAQSFRARLAISVAIILVILLVGLTVGDIVTRQAMQVAPRPEPSEAFYKR